MAMTAASATFSASEANIIAEIQDENVSPKGVSILKDIFPEHGAPCVPAPTKAPATGRMPLSLVNNIPSPARAGAGRNFQGGAQKNAPCGPPMHSPAPLAAPLVPPPPSFQASQEHKPATTTMAMLEPSSASYRERLRAGGRGAFQRAMDNGLMPKNMKQEWNGMQGQSSPAHGFLPKQQAEGQQMQYSNENQQMWNGTGQIQSNSGWCSPMNQNQMQNQQPYVQQQMMPQQMPAQMMVQMPMPQEQVQQPQMQAGGGAQQMDINSCMQLVMPQQGHFPCDRELMAAALKAAADDCQVYLD